MKSLAMNTGHRMPAIGLGTWQAKEDVVYNAVKCAIDAGYTHIDTAHAYGNEAEVGRAINDKIADGTVKRQDLFVTTKLWNTRHAAANVRPSLIEALTRLGLDYLDMFLIHWPMALKFDSSDNFPKDKDGNLIFTDTPYTQTWAALEECVKEGLVRGIGLSNFNVKQVEEVLGMCKIKPANMQIEVHPYYTNEALVQFCQDKGIVVTAYSPFASPANPWVTSVSPSIFHDATLQGIAGKHGRSIAQVVLRWLIQRNIVPIPKSIRPERITQNLQVFDFELSGEDMKSISGLHKGTPMVVPLVVKNGKREYRDKDAPYFPF